MKVGLIRAYLASRYPLSSRFSLKYVISKTPMRANNTSGAWGIAGFTASVITCIYKYIFTFAFPTLSIAMHGILHVCRNPSHPRTGTNSRTGCMCYLVFDIPLHAARRATAAAT